MNNIFNACRNGDIESVREALNGGYDVAEECSNGMSLLMLACEGGHFELSKLIAERAPFLVNGIWGRVTLSTLDFAIMSKNIELVEWLSMNYPSVVVFRNDVSDMRILEILHRYGKISVPQTCKFVEHNMIECIRFIPTPIDVYLFKYVKTTEMLVLLLEKPNKLSYENVANVLRQLVYRKPHKEIVLLLFDRFPELKLNYAEFAYEEYWHFLVFMIERGCVLPHSCVRAMVEHGELQHDVIVKIHHHPDLIYYAIAGKMLNNAKQLLRLSSIDVEKLNTLEIYPRSAYTSPLGMAMRMNHMKMVTLLIIHGASVKYYPEEIQRIYITYQNILQAYLLASTRCGEFRLGDQIASYLV